MKSSLILILTLLLFVSCGIQKREYNTVPNVSVKDDFLKDEITDSAFKSTEIVVEWWSEFNDPVLDRLIEKARQHNLRSEERRVGKENRTGRSHLEAEKD